MNQEPVTPFSKNSIAEMLAAFVGVYFKTIFGDTFKVSIAEKGEDVAVIMTFNKKKLQQVLMSIMLSGKARRGRVPAGEVKK